MILMGGGPRAGSHAKNSLWDKFVIKSFDLLVDGGFLVYVHPASWRKPENNMWEIMTSKQILHLDIHSKAEGNKVFGASTRYDWYVLENKPVYKSSVVTDEKGVTHDINLGEWKFLPNYMIKEVKNILGSGEMLHSYSIYFTLKKWMSKKKTDVYNKPVVHCMNKNGIVYNYSSLDKGHFGIPKVILSFNEKQYPINDYKGEYGMSQITFGIPISSKKEGDDIVKAINSDKFKEIIKATKWGHFRLTIECLSISAKTSGRSSFDSQRHIHRSS